MYLIVLFILLLKNCHGRIFNKKSMKCKECKYWERETWQSYKCINRITGKIKITTGFKECETYRKEIGEIIHEEYGDCNHPDTWKDVIDISDEYSIIVFMENFGCIHFEQK